MHSNHFSTKFITDFCFLSFKLTHLPFLVDYMLKITILISKDYDIDIYKILRYIAKTVVLLSPTFISSVIFIHQRASKIQYPNF